MYNIKDLSVLLVKDANKRFSGNNQVIIPLNKANEINNNINL